MWLARILRGSWSSAQTITLAGRDKDAKSRRKIEFLFTFVR